ncbi:MAG: hypothetical protein ACC742_15720 [Thermoanaerobaculales bacterium]
MSKSTALALVACLVALVPTPVAAQKLIFWTSVTGTADLSTWSDAGGNTGLAAGDAICVARAQVAGLPNASSFIAWLSDAGDDAYCRLHGLTGKKASNCGQASLPVAAGPWVRVDGFPFGEEISQLLTPTGKVYTPVMFNEFGAFTDIIYFTGTNSSGELDTSYPGTCSNWTAASTNMVMDGQATTTTDHWSSQGWVQCSVNISLLCVEAGGSGPALGNFASTGRKAFVTSVSGDGNLSGWADAGGKTGLAAGDAICAARAQAAGLSEPASFKAWLSDSTTDAVSRFTNDGRWVRVDGVPVANDISDLTDGQLFTSINVTETGLYLGNIWVWTGTDKTGVKKTDLCSNWSDGSSGNGSPGGANRSNGTWTGLPVLSGCASTYRLYCLSDADISSIFADGFESGSTSAWNDTVG